MRKKHGRYILKELWLSIDGWTASRFATLMYSSIRPMHTAPATDQPPGASLLRRGVRQARIPS